MYLSNKYTAWYFGIIAKAKARVKCVEFMENHHIIPKSLGGSNLKENIVSLTPKEHYICHLLLPKMVDGSNRRKMWYAHFMMMRGTKRYKPCSRMYEYARQNMIRANKERPGPNLGKKLSAETRQKQSDATKGIPRGPHSEEHKNKLKKPKTEEHKKKISEARKGKSWGYKHSDETKHKMSLKSKGRVQPVETCEFCSKTVAIGNYKRWHGERCKANT